MSQFNSTTYDIQRPTGQCAVTGKTLEPQDEYIATLVENPETDDLVRVDVSLEAWEDETQRPTGVFSYWKAVVPEPTAKKKMFVDDGVLMNLIQRLADAEQPQRLAFRFVLTLIMMRKKLLRYDTTDYCEVDAPPPPPPPSPAEDNDAPQAEAAENAETEVEVEAEEATNEPPEKIIQEWWTLTTKVDLAKGPMGKWNESEKIKVLNPQLDDEGIGQVTEQLNDILQAEL